MLCQRSVASFAVHISVLARGLCLQDVGVARFACFVSGEVNRASCDLCDCGAAVVPVLPKTLRHNEVPNHKENDKGDYKQEREPEEVSCIFEEVHRINFSFPTSATRDCYGSAGDAHSDMKWRIGLYVTVGTRVRCR
jgi:hypothetical protein